MSIREDEMKNIFSKLLSMEISLLKEKYYI